MSLMRAAGLDMQGSSGAGLALSSPEPAGYSQHMGSLMEERLVPVLQARGWATRGRLYAVVDGCGAPSVPDMMRKVGDRRAVSLYRGRAEEELWGIAPYLVQVDGAVFDWLSRTLWAEPWGFFGVTDAELPAVRLHLRRFLVVESPEGEPWYFRFYDPRVLRKYLPTLDATRLAEFMGPFRALAVTDPVSYGVSVLTPAAGRSPS